MIRRLNSEKPKVMMLKTVMQPRASMKQVFGHKLPCFHSSQTGCLVLAVFVLAFAGCKKAQTTSAPAPETANNQSQTDQTPSPASVPTATAPTTSSPLVTPSGDPDLGALNRTLLRWILSNRRPPRNFDDFAATAGVTIPPSPAGKKYIIGQNMRIQLVNQ